MSKRRVNYICNQLGIKLRTFDPHPFRKEANVYTRNPEDCVVRSISKLTNTEYKNVYNSLMERAKKLYISSFTYKKVFVDEIREKYHYELYKLPKYETLGEFMHKHKTGRFIVTLDDHMLSYINGIWYDSDDVLKFADIYLTRKVEFVACEMKYSKYI